jgi:TRAP-type mannitol/chloroaromatic compound transport system permease large subunit
MIPPSGLAVLLGAVGEISIGKILIAIIVPGLVLAALYGLYIIGRCFLQPSLAPAYDVPPQPLWEKIKITVKYIVPLLAIIFMVTGVIILGSRRRPKPPRPAHSAFS